ncbi:hypothetical protein NDU88_006689 [Pleurodeles waltl]|uniref:Uncharacterized protein n=1 Tax=Pleurodeles waltl TaxID=8319 RepID=A0AAV7MKN3_PLEWA|nr:hypothetical protein NDU88_006689 [Pleurodeles waltl]
MLLSSRRLGPLLQQPLGHPSAHHRASGQEGARLILATAPASLLKRGRGTPLPHSGPLHQWKGRPQAQEPAGTPQTRSAGLDQGSACTRIPHAGLRSGYSSSCPGDGTG